MRLEWPTLLLIAACYFMYVLGLTWAVQLWLPLGILVTMLAIALHTSLQHEVAHGHPLPSKPVSEALVFVSLNLAFPFQRFRDTHLAHHRDANLTDPYDDPESNYVDPGDWARLSAVMQAVLRWNNTLAGRMLIGPVIGQVAFMRMDLRAWQAGDTGVLAPWFWHGLTSAVVLGLVASLTPMPLWAYLVAAYGALSILKIRTFLEHQAHEHARGRTVIIEDRGLLAFLFLNNNFHVVHHMHPKLPWYRLPGQYFEDPDRYLRRNDGYRYANYAQIFRQYFWRAKDPVPHPLRQSR